MAEASAMFTCITCRVAFTDSEVQRAHYKTDWHRYNLKRKVAEMPPVTAENFQQRVLAQREKASAQEKNTSSHCRICNKHFSTLNAFNNHLQSKKHRDLVSKEKHRIRVEENNRINKELTLANQKDAVNEALKNSMQAGIGQSEDQSASSHSKKSQSGKASLLVLAKDTDEEDMEADDSDAESWESFDGEGLGVEECLFCSYISQSLEENLGHMTTKHSFFIPDAEFVSDLEGLISYLGEKVGEGNVCLWCNERGRHFQSTQAVQRHMVDKGHCKIVHEGEAIFEYADFYDYRSSYPDFDPESAEGATGGAVVAVEDSGIEDSLLETDGYELVLPSGAVIGHRSLQRYFRQNIPARREGRTRSIMPKLLAQYKALGWTGIKGEAAVQKAKDLTVFRRIRDKHRMQVGVKANKLQHHFRPQVVF